MDDEDLMVGGDDLDYEEYDLDEEQENALLEESEVRSVRRASVRTVQV